jgi:hypothetical protein
LAIGKLNQNFFKNDYSFWKALSRPLSISGGIGYSGLGNPKTKPDHQTIVIRLIHNGYAVGP